jgi:hypothetical protein
MDIWPSIRDEGNWKKSGMHKKEKEKGVFVVPRANVSHIIIISITTPLSSHQSSPFLDENANADKGWRATPRM